MINRYDRYRWWIEVLCKKNRNEKAIDTDGTYIKRYCMVLDRYTLFNFHHCIIMLIMI